MILFAWLDFLLDLPSLETWLKETYPESFDYILAGGNLKIAFNEPQEDSVKTAIQAYLDSLTSNGEAAKRALKSRLRGASTEAKRQEYRDFEQAVKNFLPTKDITTLSLAEKKFVMGASLTNDEYDTLTSS